MTDDTRRRVVIHPDDRYQSLGNPRFVEEELEHPVELWMQLSRMAVHAGVDERDAEALTKRFLLALAQQNGEIARDIAEERGWIGGSTDE